MPFQIIVREILPASTSGARPLTNAEVAGVACGYRGEQTYEQVVETLDLSKVIAAVNFKPRVRKPRTAKIAPSA